MRIHIANLGLPEFFDRKSDIIYGLYHAFSSLGHDLSVGHNIIENKRLNIIIGSDIISGDAEALLSLQKNKCDYAIYEVENYNGTIPSVLEIPSKGKAYDPRKDTIMKRVSAMLGKE